MSARQWPAPVRPRWVSGLVAGVPVPLGVAASWGMPGLAEWFLEQNLPLGLLMDFGLEPAQLHVGGKTRAGPAVRLQASGSRSS